MRVKLPDVVANGEPSLVGCKHMHLVSHPSQAVSVGALLKSSIHAISGTDINDV